VTTKQPCHWVNSGIPCNRDGELLSVCDLYYCDEHSPKVLRLRAQLQAYGRAKRDNPEVQIFAFV
jgi:hypothetical protein